MRERVLALRDAYEALCVKLAGFPAEKEAEKQAQRADGGAPRLRGPEAGDKVLVQATHPEKNSTFIREGSLGLTQSSSTSSRARG